MVPASNLRQCPLLLHISTCMARPWAGSPPVPGAVVASVTGSFCTFQSRQSNTGEGGEDQARYRNELKGIKITDGTKVSDVIGAKQVEADYVMQDGDSLRS